MGLSNSIQCLVFRVRCPNAVGRKPRDPVIGQENINRFAYGLERPPKQFVRLELSKPEIVALVSCALKESRLTERL